MTYKVLQDRYRNIAEAGDAHPDGTTARRVSVWTPSSRPLEVQSRIGVDPADDTLRGVLLTRAVRSVTTDTAEISLGQYRGIAVIVTTYTAPAFTLGVNAWALSSTGQPYQWSAGATINTIRTAAWFWYPGASTTSGSGVVFRSDIKPPAKVYFSIALSGGSWDYEVSYELLA